MSTSDRTKMTLSLISCLRARRERKAGRKRLKSLRWNMKKSLRRYRHRKPQLLNPSHKMRARQRMRKVAQTQQLWL